MKFDWKQWTFPAILAIGGFVLMNGWEEEPFARYSHLLGSGMLLLAAWWSLYVLHRLSVRSSNNALPFSKVAAKTTKSAGPPAWISLAVHLAITAYFFTSMQKLNWNHSLSDPRAETMAVTIIFALVVWYAISASWMRQPGAEQAASASASEYRVTLTALLALVVSAAVYLGLRADSLQPLPPMLVANVLVGMILIASLMGAASRLLPTRLQTT